MGYLRDIEKLIRITLPREDQPHAGSSRHRAGAGAASRRAAPAPRAQPGQRPMKAVATPHPGRKALAVRRRPGGNNAAPQTNRHETNRHEPARPSSQAGGKAEGMQGVAFLHRESRPNTQPNRTQRPQR